MATPGGGSELWGDRRSMSSKNWEDSVFGRSSTVNRDEDDEEALKWAAIEKLPTYNRIRTAILKNVENGRIISEEIDVTKFGIADRQQFIQKILHVTEEDNERFLLKLRDRIDKVGIELPKIEVRYKNLNINAGVYVGSRALPTLLNYTANIIEGVLNSLHLLPSKKRTLNILNNVSGIIKPSRMTLLLGPPNAGKTTLLLALAGKLDEDLKVSGRITYNGHELTEFVPQRTSAYISQHDLHIGELTVRETLDFSGRCQGVGTRYEMLMELSRREKAAGIKPDPDTDVFMKATALEGQETSIVTDYILKILGLDICADTLVGDEMRRGISGGQKKRVTTGEMLVGPAKALFMDEISTGLDSSTTFQIVKCLRQSVHVMDGTMVVSLLQPAPETFALFDDLILLSEGQIVYQGPCDLVLDFFGSVGFQCPERKGVADFLQEVTSRKDQRQYWADKSQPYQYVSVKNFAEAFSRFHVGQSLAEELAVPFDKSKSHPAALVTEKYALGSWELFKACFAREWILIKRNYFIYVFKTAQLIVLGTFTMTTFLRTKMHHTTVEDGNKYMGAIFFGLIIVMFNGFAELSLTVMRLPVFYKQRDLKFYPAWAFTLPTFVLRVPMSFYESFLWVFLTYWVIGYDPEPGRFFKQYMLLFFVHNMSLGLFRFIAAMGRTMIVASTFGAFALLVVFVLGGFIVSRNSIHPWWIWGYWISPLMYGQNAIAVNEFLGKRWQHTNPFLSGETVGVAVLKSRGIFPSWYWYWISIGALVGYAIVFNVMFTLGLTFLNPLGKPQAIVTEEALEEKRLNRTGEGVKSDGNSLPGHTELQVRRSSLSSIDGNTDQLGAAAEAAMAAGKRGMVLPFQPLSIAFDHINYYVDMPPEMKKQGEEQDRLQLLRDVSGAFRPGVLTALVGVSGAGKTTLMDVLAGRKTGGYIEGTISVSGFPKRQETFARIAGYCEQNDIHSPQVTVYESLVFSAWLRLPREVDKRTREMFVEEVMELVELNALRDGIVGLPGVTGLSTEQRKRLTIAVELVANPSIIFMDEPTSGLDARAAAIVMRTVRNTVDTGRTVVCTIHQPSIDIFEAFDELLLMKRGGQVIYAGSLGKRSHKLVEYFQAVDGVPAIEEGYNPATWMLEVSSQSAEAKLGVDFAEIYKNSTLYMHNQELITQLSSPAPDAKDLSFDTEYSQTFNVQCIACLWKQHKSYWRNPYYCVIRMFFTTVCALMFGTIFWNLGSKRGTQQDLFNLMGSMYAAVLFIGVNNSSAVQPVVGVERTVFYRERAAGMYSAFPYAFGQVLIEIPYVLYQSIVYGLLVYSMINFEWTAVKFFWYLYFMFCTLLFFTYYGMMAVSLTPSHQFAAITSSAFVGLWNLFSGYLVTRPNIPIWWRWFVWIDPFAWTLNGLITSQLGDVRTGLTIPGRPDRPEVRVFLHEYFGFHHDFLGAIAAVHIGLAIIFAFTFAICIKYLNFQKR
ncbi:hypothetical protein O6H91_06G097000 [Diphasiastrum complanatum]|uniref:Uncharacterized protein n=17 Tax=Diphasiastrum complanatum TaxID=34168 RepID=A0ACC2DGP2_DIPCM|nr:hypothetical protein O6H91_06G097000 [Diphasiastrum complanatum]KAJ7553409.1 hypothetical protein O6H91_06G097000 [Diphasiastrum complanatum]KAJ7553410.1 hypothetical protein O6H91_06G097000 [Diphasiastrum complanatum]KAJ7553411.1 hypothetical protein O6H91_06G097000 [Diphasiastrum complanatum]KAJ7553412.1 hypothetical protein O6H91_06G097000 [Diphasiastrum complanatum]